MIERKIVIGLITSTQYLKKIRPIWQPLLIESNTARIISGWAIEYFDKFGKAPKLNIESIYHKKVKEGLDKELAEEIEEDILPELSEEYVKSNKDIDFLITSTFEHLKSQQLLQYSEQINNILENGNGSIESRLKEVDEIRAEFKPISEVEDTSLDLSTEKALEAIKKAFIDAAKPVIIFPKQLGEFWNAQMVPGAFISLLAIEKRGKTFMLLEMALKASRQNKKVAFFQAGDMNEAEQLRRLGVYLTKRSDKEKYCNEHFEPVRDCILSQMDVCQKRVRETDWSPFEDTSEEYIRNIEAKELQEIVEASPDYRACSNCPDYDTKKYGVPWLKKNPKTNPIQAKDAEKAVINFFHKKKRRFKLDTYANGTLSVNMIVEKLDMWEEQDGFVPDVIIIDYADLLVPSIRTEFRHQQNQIWKDLRRLSQTPRKKILPLVIAPTQADAEAYKTFRLTLSNFSEDKRKNAHVVAMYGLNQDSKGREKSLGLMRINEVLIREGASDSTSEVTVLQNLRQGRPVIGSYF